MSQILQAKINTVRRKQVIVAVATGVAASVGAFVILLGVSMLLDFWLNLSFTLRAALLAINLAAVVSILLYSIFGPILYGPDDDEIALMVEDAEPAFRTRLIASVQLSRPAAAPAGASTSLIGAMIAQAESLAGPMDFGRVIKTDSLVRIIVLSLLAFVVVGGTFAWGGEVSRDLLKRSLFLSDTPVPRKTRVVVLTGSPLVARGDAIDIYALAEGVNPTDSTRIAYLRTLPTDKSAPRKQELTLDPVTPLDADRIEKLKEAVRASGKSDEDVAKDLARINPSALVFAGRLENLQESFEYTVRLNDGDSQKFTVKVLPRPAITKIEARQVFPKYTNRPTEPRPLGDLSLLRGSKLELAVTVNKPLRGPTDRDKVPNFAHLIGTNVDVPLAVDAKNPAQLTGLLDLPKGTTGFSINLTDTDGLKSKDPAVYRVDLVDDKVPTARILFPTRKEVLAVQEATQRIVFQAADDFAIGSAAIKYKVDDGPETPIKLNLPGNTPKTFNGEYVWKLNEIRVAAASAKPAVPPTPVASDGSGATTPKVYGEDSVIEYWVEVEDTRDAANGGPNKGMSEHYMLRIVSKEKKKEEIRGRMAEIGSALHMATDDQEQVATKVQTILLEKKLEPGIPAPAPTPAPK